MAKNKRVIRVRKLRNFIVLYNNDYISGLCHSFETSSLNKLWQEYWEEVNTANYVMITPYFDKSSDLEERYLLRLLVLNDFCNQYGYELRY